MKWALLVLLCVLLVPVVARADTPSAYELSQVLLPSHEVYGQDDAAIQKQQFDRALAEQEENATYMERLAAGLVIALPNYLIKVLRLQDPVALIFQERPQSNTVRQTVLENYAYTPPEDLYLWTFRENEFRAVAVMYETVRAYLPIILVLAIVFVGVALYLAAWNDRRASLKEYLLGLVVALVALRFGVYFWKLVFDLNRSLVELFRSSFPDAGSFFDLLWKPDTQSLGMAVISLLVAFSVGALNWQYIMRKITLGVLIFIFPVVAAVSVTPSKRRALDIWAREFLANVFLQSAHAGAYAFFLVFAGNAFGNPDWLWYAGAFIMGINGVAGLIRRLIGAETVGGGGAGLVGAAVGAGSLMALARMGSLIYAGQVALRSAGETPAGPAGISGTPSGGPPGSGLPGAPGVGGGGAQSFGLRVGGLMAEGAAHAVNAAAVGIGSLAGGMIAGALTGNEQMGVAAGAAVGSFITNPIEHGLNASGRAMRQIADQHAATGESVLDLAKERLGIFDAAQLYDVESAATIGSRLGGTPGAVVGGAASLVAQGLHRTTGLGDELAARAAAFKNARIEAQRDWVQARDGYNRALPVLQVKKERLTHTKAQYGEQSAQFVVAAEEYNKVLAEASLYKSDQLDAESRLTHQGVKDLFAKLREDQAAGRLRGGLFDYGWHDDESDRDDDNG